MAKRESRMMELGMRAPEFLLNDGAGVPHALADAQGSRAVLVAFLCNHCPYVVHVLPEFVRFAREYTARGVAVYAISANDADAYPADAPAAMAEFARRMDFPFPYLYDESQETALAYGAVCTPDFFLFDAQGRLSYRGQFDGSRPNSHVPVTGHDLRAACEALLAGGAPDPDQRPSLGCSIKWRPGRAPDWA